MSLSVLIILIVCFIVFILWFLNHLSYTILKRRIIRGHTWDLNICCGRVDGGGINADIFAHAKVPKLVIVDVNQLPFRDRQFNTVLCSHTIEHVPKPEKFLSELQRVGENVTIILPPLWDVSAALNFFEHRWIFLTFKKSHASLPPRIKLPFARTYQRKRGQRLSA